MFLTLQDYKKKKFYVDRKNIKNISIIDCHIHFRAFGHYSKRYKEVLDYLVKAGVLFATVTGIGQRLPFKSECVYYGDCPTEVIKPSIINDIINLENYNKLYNLYKNKIHLILSWTALDLHNPKESYTILNYVLNTYKGMYKSCGEINLCKQALFSHKRFALPIEKIKDNKKVMALLLKHKIPILIHCDLGNNKNNTKYLKLITTFIKTYKNNKIIWAHFGGICKELTNLNTPEHINILNKLLNKYPNLYIDISWDAVIKILCCNKENIRLYVDFINNNSKRFITGSDFVGSSNKLYKSYKNDMSKPRTFTNKINDEAYTNIFLGKNYIKLYNLKFNIPILKNKK